MFPEQLKKILNLCKKTGDRVVIFEASAPENSYVVMDFDRYAAMLGEEGSTPASVNSVSSPAPAPINVEKESLTEEDLTDKINREISLWKNRENSPGLAEESRDLAAEAKPKKAWNIPPQVKDRAQAVE
jgi:hypothetical protein